MSGPDPDAAGASATSSASGRHGLTTATLAARDGDRYRVEYIEHEPRGLNRYLSLLFGRAAAFVRSEFGWEGAAQALLGSSTVQVRRELEMLATARRQPLTAFSYCFCELRQSP